MAHILIGSLLQMGKGPFCTQTHTLGHNSPSNAALGVRRGEARKEKEEEGKRG